MTRYTTKPQTVEAMQWLGPDDPAHVAEFEAWMKSMSETAEIKGNYISFCGENLRLFAGCFYTFDGNWFDGEEAEFFLLHHTPTPDVEGAP